MLLNANGVQAVAIQLLRCGLVLAGLLGGTMNRGLAADDAPANKVGTLKIGIIGLDTSHSTAFTQMMNAPQPRPEFADARIIAAYAQGSRDIPGSVSRVPEYTATVRQLGVAIVPTIPELLMQVDYVLLESNDGRPHLEQVIPVLKAKKPCFIDKPFAGSLADILVIAELAKRYETPIFSSSSLRFGPKPLELRSGALGEVISCDAYSPAALEATHPDLFWYGIHGVELLYTVMGPGCETVSRAHTPQHDVVVGTWSKGRIGTFRGIREGASGYGGRAMTNQGIHDIGGFAGYEPLVVEILKFFRTRQAPVTLSETIELYTFMEAADESKRRGGAPVSLKETLAKAEAQARETLSRLP